MLTFMMNRQLFAEYERTMSMLGTDSATYIYVREIITTVGITKVVDAPVPVNMPSYKSLVRTSKTVPDKGKIISTL